MFKLPFKQFKSSSNQLILTYRLTVMPSLINSDSNNNQSSSSSTIRGDTPQRPNGITSIHAAGITEVHEVPMDVIIRPIPPILDEDKVESLMETLKVNCSCGNNN